MFDRLGASERSGGDAPPPHHSGTRALEGLQALLARFLFAPEVTLMDVGAEAGTGAMVLQLHVRSLAGWTRLAPPEEVIGIPVRPVVHDDDLEG